MSNGPRRVVTETDSDTDSDGDSDEQRHGDGGVGVDHPRDIAPPAAQDVQNLLTNAMDNKETPPSSESQQERLVDLHRFVETLPTCTPPPPFFLPIRCMFV